MNETAISKVSSNAKVERGGRREGGVGEVRTIISSAHELFINIILVRS